MKLIIVRHGETEENTKDIVQGHLPGHLTKKGIKQAKAAGLALKREKIDAIFSSDLKRTRDTCMEIAKYHSAPVYYTRQLRERNIGIYAGMTGPEVHAMYKEGMARTGTDSFTFKPEGGESTMEARDRLSRFFQKLYKKYRDKTVLIVTHGGIIKTIIHLYENVSLEEAKKIKPENASIRMIKVNDKNIANRPQT